MTVPSITLGTAATIDLVVNASGQAAGGIWPSFKILLDGMQLGQANASSQHAQSYAFSVPAASRSGTLQILYDNDGNVGEQDRNLTIHSLLIDTTMLLPTDSGVRYHVTGAEQPQTLPGQSDMWWNGSLDFTWPLSGGAASSGVSGLAPWPLPLHIPPDEGGVPAEPSEPGNADGRIAPGFLHTSGSQILDSAGNAIRLTGVNWFGAEGYAFAPQGLWQDSYQSIMAEMLTLGFNVIRLPFSDAMLDSGRMPTGINYNLNPDLFGKTSLEVFDAIIAHADKIGMKIILDHHRSGDGASANENGLWYTTQYPEHVMIRNWQMLAERYKGNDAVIGADLHNEPHGPASWGDGSATDWARAAERIGNAIQQVNSDWLMIVEGIERVEGDWYWWGGNLLNQPRYNVSFDVPNKLVYSVHEYGPSLYMMEWFRDPAYPANLPDKWTEVWGRLVQNDQHPVLVGEFGTKLATTMDDRWLKTLMAYMNGDWNLDGVNDLAPGHQGVNWTYWAWSPGSWDTGGLMTDDWVLNTAKYDILKDGLF